MINEFFKDVPCHNNEELTKIAREMIMYARKELQSIKELNPVKNGEVDTRMLSYSKELQPIIEYYKHMILISTEFLIKTNQELP